MADNIFPFPFGNDPLNGIYAPDLSKITLGKEPEMDFSFVGNIRLPIRRKMVNSMVDRDPEISFIYAGRHQFWGANRDKQQFTDYMVSLIVSHAVLCPRGAGLNSIRFFETISAGRVPVLISDPIGLPFSDVVDYRQFIISIDAAHVSDTATLLKRWLQRFGRKRLRLMGESARKAHDEQLHYRHWPRHIHRHLSSLL